MAQSDYTYTPVELIDLETGLGRVRGKKSLYKRMLGLFLASEEFAAFDQNLAAGDLAKAAENAHAIKGMTANLSLDAVSKTSEALMVQLREGTQDQAALDAYRAALAQTIDAVNALLPTLED